MSVLLIVTVPVIRIVLIPMEVICASVKMVLKKLHLMSVKVATYIKFYQKHYKLYIRFLIEGNATHISMGHFE